ncbi:MAG: stage III sporulation protein AB [Clostridia bacterium]|nr:stage III sporulation protein AB [Clostridia bacterium]
MFVVKMVMICLIILICNAIGKIKADSFQQRYLELKKLKRGLGIFRSKLEFTYEPVGEIFEDISRLVYEEEDNIFKRFLENNDWNLAIENQKNFEKEDKEVAKGLGKMLGKLDKDGQLNEIYLVDGFIDKQIEEAFEVKQKNEKLYKVLGRSVGLAIAIILI